mgnify:FL=1
MDALDCEKELLGGFPPGTRDWLDFADPDGPGPLIQALGATLYDTDVKPTDQLRKEVNPSTCQGGQAEWERTLGLTGTDTSRFGDVLARRAQIMSRLRESGATTVPLIQSVIAPLLDYADPSQLVVREVSRSFLRSAHSYFAVGPLAIGLTTVQLQFLVRDTAAVSKSGAQVDLNLTHPVLQDVRVSLTAPDGRFIQKGFVEPRLGEGSVNGFVRIYFPEMAGAVVAGLWTLQITALTPGTVASAILFVEGFGRDASGADGLSAAKFHWAVIAEPALMGPRADRAAAAAAIRRINYATRVGVLAYRSSGAGALPAGQLAAIPDDPGAIPDACIPG